MTMVIRSLSLNSPARSRWRSSLASCLFRQPGSNAFQKSSTAQKSSSRLMVGCLSVRGNVEDNTSFERHPALSITHVIYEEIDRGIRYWDKMLLCCSKSSLSEKWWVDQEINKAFQKERDL